VLERDAVLEKMAGLFEVVLDAASVMLEADKVRILDNPEEPPPEEEAKHCFPPAESWAMLLRTLNLGGAALTAARAGYGETVALVARCLEEMVYQVACSEDDAEWFQKRFVHAFRDICRGLPNLADSLTEMVLTPRLRAKAVAGMDQFMAEAKETLEELGTFEGKWDRRIQEWARKAGLLEDYENEYRYLSMQVHTAPPILGEYILERGGQVEVRRRISRVAARVYFHHMVCYWFGVLLPLLEPLGVKMFGAFEEATADMMEYLLDADLTEDSGEPPPW
jgi:hypothetical protein